MTYNVFSGTLSPTHFTSSKHVAKQIAIELLKLLSSLTLLTFMLCESAA